jgi:hypothetical protein
MAALPIGNTSRRVPLLPLGSGLEQSLELGYRSGGIETVGVLADLPQSLFDLVKRLVKSGAFAASDCQELCLVPREGLPIASSLLHSFPAAHMKGRSFALGVQLDTSAAAVADWSTLALDLAPAAHQTRGHLAVLSLGLDPVECRTTTCTCSGLQGIHGCGLQLRRGASRVRCDATGVCVWCVATKVG